MTSNRLTMTSNHLTVTSNRLTVTSNQLTAHAIGPGHVTSDTDTGGSGGARGDVAVHVVPALRSQHAPLSHSQTCSQQ